MQNKSKNKMKTKKKGRLPLIAGALLILTAIIILYTQNQRLKNKKEKAINLEKQLEQNITTKENTTETKNQDNQDNKDNQENRTEKTEDTEETKDKIKTRAIGVIRIDKTETVIPIYKTADITNLTDGAGIIKNTDLPTSKENTVTAIAGHRGGRNEEQSFLNIDRLKEGDIIKITTEEEILKYKVIKQEIIEPDDWSKFIREEGKTKLFLVTCHPYPHDYQRLIVEAELIREGE